MPATAPTSANTATTTASPNPTAQANAANSTTPSTAPATQIYGSSTVTNANTANPTITNNSTPQASTTVQSNDNTINNTVPAITNTTKNLANTSGVSTNSSGQPTYSNGTLVQPPAGETYVNGQLTYTGTNGTGTNNNISPQGTLITGGYIGDTYYAPGTLAANIPTDANGQPQQLSSQGTTDSQILANLQTAKSQADSLTASLIDSITSQYNSLIQNQQQANSSQQATVGHSLIKEGTSQLDPIGAAQVTQAQVSYGLSQIASLQSKEQSAIIAAQQAGQDEDFKLQDQMNQEAAAVRTQQQDAAKQILDAVTTLNAQQAQIKLQAQTDEAIGNLYNQGMTDPTQIINTLSSQGMNVDADMVSKAITALNPDKATIQSVAAQAAAAGATPDVINQILASTTAAGAISLATPALGAKWANTLQQQQFTDNLQLKQLAVSQANAGIAEEKLKADMAAQGLTIDSKGNILPATLGSGTVGNEAQGAIVTTTSGKKYIDATNLPDAAKGVAANSGYPVLVGAPAQAMNGIQNAQGQVTALLGALQTAGMIDSNGKWTGSAPGSTLTRLLGHVATTSSTPVNNALNGFNTGIKGMVTDISKLPDTGQLVATLNSNNLKTTDTPQILQQKITAVTSALENEENNLLSNGIAPQQVILNGKTLNLQPDGTYE